MPARSVCLVTLSLSEAGPGRFGRQVSVTDIYHTIPPHHTMPPAYGEHGLPSFSTMMIDSKREMKTERKMKTKREMQNLL